MTDETPFKPSGTSRKLGPYRLFERLGEGGMGEVWLAERPTPAGTAKKLVLKRIRPDSATNSFDWDRFRQEAALSMNLSHPHLLHVYGFEEWEGERLLLLEFVDGVDLSEIRDFFSILEVWQVTLDVTQALAYLHTHPEGPFFHGDVSPRNVLIDRTGWVKLADFGLISDLNPQRSNGTDAPLAGTPGFLSPKRLRGQPPDESSDLYALGRLIEWMIERSEASDDERRETLLRLVRGLTSDRSDEREDARGIHSRLSDGWDSEGASRVRLAENIKSIQRDSSYRPVPATLRMPPSDPKNEITPQAHAETLPVSSRSRKIGMILATFLLLLAAAGIAVVRLHLWPASRAELLDTSRIQPIDRSGDLWDLSLLPIDAEPDCEIVVDGKRTERTPTVLKLRPGRHDVSFQFAGEPVTCLKTVFLKPGSNSELYLKREACAALSGK